ncbi:Phosphoglycolate phosphatase, chromosomal [Pigmentiphaga humi]|uniref:Phosphoglycolate phosphatase n=1 Tax=Pigmentiphaga humi TaxID=2478468 RepID=A0A3P4B8J6_9BURK|nr:phosphoglycolate phosphatase [Pigmentiphaga humi]VCU72563.1 Phosphoglycolate phosphatase, chromosomal [Pigmentiphaga humi]
MTYRAVLIDLDGTLVDSVPDLAHAANAMRVAFGLTPLREDVIATFVGKGMENLVHRTLSGSLEGEAERARFPDALQAFRDAYHVVNGEKARVFEGVVEGLQDMKAQGLRVAVVTNKPAEFTLPLLERIGLRAYFDAVVSGDSVARKKPDPMPMLHACELLGVQPAEAVVVGDSMNDASAARAAGCRVLLVPYGYNEGRDVHAIESDGIVATLLDAARWVSQSQVLSRTPVHPQA